MKRLDENRLLVERQGSMRVDAVIYADDRIRLEDSAVDQLKDAASLPGVSQVLATPDIHHGYGVPIGSVVAMKEAVIPAAVGYDINCGMRVVTTPFKREEVDVDRVAESIARDVPLGEGRRNVRLSQDEFRVVLERGVRGLAEIDRGNARVWQVRRPEDEAEDIAHIEDFGSLPRDASAISARAMDRGHEQLATLGGGNHFIEVQVVERVENAKVAEAFHLFEGQICVMIHTGSRGFGHQVADEYMRTAKNKTVSQSPNPHLCFLPADSPEGQRYIGAMRAAANFAYTNRQMLTQFVRHNIRHLYGDAPMPIVYDVTHNMAKLETHGRRELWVHRKGATRAFPPERMKDTPFEEIGQPELIPGSMGTASYVLVGTSRAAESLFSVNHGAGRVMSRTAATGRGRGRRKKQRPAAISDKRFAETMRGIKLICADRRSVKEEAPDAYKDIDAVIEVVAAAGLAEVVARLRPLAVLKG